MNEKKKKKEEQGTVFEDAMRYVDNVRKTLKMMNANGFKLIVDDQHAEHQPVFWLPRHELVELQTHMLKFGFERVTQLIAAMRGGISGKLSAAVEEVSRYSPTKVCFEGSVNQPAYDEVLFGPKACMPFYRMMLKLRNGLPQELQKTIKVCIQGGWNVKVVPEGLTGEAAAPNAGAGVHVGSLAKRVKLEVKRGELLPLGLPSQFAN